MKITVASKSWFYVLVFSLFFPTSAQEQWSQYQPRTLKQIVSQHLDELLDDNTQVSFLFTADTFPSRVKVVYEGKSRNISEKKKQLISEWAKTRKGEAEIVSLFEKEILFTEDSVQYWIPVQNELFPFFAERLKKGDKVELLLIWIGGRKEAGTIDWGFLVNEFVEPLDFRRTPSQRNPMNPIPALGCHPMI